MRDMVAEFRELDRIDRESYEADPRDWFRQAARFDRRSRRRCIVDLLNKLGGVGMARGKGQRPTATPATGQAWTTFVEIPVPPEAWGDIQTTYGEWEPLYEAVTDAVSAGHRLSVSYNGQNDTFNVSLTGKGDECLNDGKTLVSFATTWFAALQVAMYKHHVIADGDWTSTGAAARKPTFG